MRGACSVKAPGGALGAPSQWCTLGGAMSRLAKTLPALLVALGCGATPKPEPIVATIAVPEAPAAVASTPTPSATGSTAPKRCSLRLQVEREEKVESCYLETRVHEGVTGELRFPCDRHGSAEAIFEDAVFSGDLQGSRIHLHFERQFPYDDHCTWTTLQQIDGSLDAEFLSFTYDEQAAEQQGCMAACSATARLRLSSFAPDH